MTSSRWNHLLVEFVGLTILSNFSVNSQVCTRPEYHDVSAEYFSSGPFLGSVGNADPERTRARCVRMCGMYLAECRGYTVTDSGTNCGVFGRLVYNSTGFNSASDTTVVVRGRDLARDRIVSCTSSTPLASNCGCEQALDGSIVIGRGTEFIVSTEPGVEYGVRGWIRLFLAENRIVVGVRALNRCMNLSDQAKDAIISVGDVAENVRFECLATCSLRRFETLPITPTYGDNVKLELLTDCNRAARSKTGVTEMTVLVI